jgi:predicted glycogen debranching enzyme
MYSTDSKDIRSAAYKLSLPPPKHIQYGRELHNLEVAESREFLMVQKKAYSSSSFAGNTRRYHGLLVINEHVFLSALHENINGISLLPGFFGNAQPDLSYIHAASLYPVVIRLEFPDCSVIKTLSFNHGFIIQYEVIGTANLCIRPLVTYRDVRALGYQNISTYENESIPNAFSIQNCIISSDLSFTRDETIYNHAYYPKEAERGYEAHEDLFSPGIFHGTVTNGTVTISCQHSDLLIKSKGEILDFSDGTGRKSKEKETDGEDLLARAAGLCHQTSQIYAGYHWFLESWGRDTFISLPGLLLECGQLEKAEEIFSWHLEHARDGLVQNRFPDAYNSSDGTLWLFWALSKYCESWPEQAKAFINQHKSTLADLIAKYPHTNITTLDDNLISVAPATGWMDTAFTPRVGKPVEINSLWMHALEFCEKQDISVPVHSMQVKHAFSAYWNEERGCLYDLLDPQSSSLRPNQLIPLGLGQLSKTQADRALDLICAELITPYGPRTLGKGEHGYFSSFHGDSSYHNGMVWPWLIGFFIDALIFYDYCDPAPYLLPLYEYLLTDGAGMLPEIFDGTAPYRAHGTICQAWSIGEFIRARNKVNAKKEKELSAN